MEAFPFKPTMHWAARIATRFREQIWRQSPPSKRGVCDLLNTAFWASMQAEEGHPVQTSLTLVDTIFPAPRFHFSEPIAFSSQALAKLSASFPRRVGSIAIRFASPDKPLISGLVLPKPDLACTVEILGPGHLVIKENSFTVLATLLPDGSRIEHSTRGDDLWQDLLSDTRHFFKVPFEYSFQFFGFLKILSQAMASHRRGGSVLIVGEKGIGEKWRSGLDFSYEFEEPADYLLTLVKDLRKWQNEWSKRQDRKLKGKERPPNDLRFYPESKKEATLEQAIKLVGGLTAVDGTMVMTSDLEVLGYGAKLKPPPKYPDVRQLIPWQKTPESVVSLQDLGGTRHQSAARFVYDNPECLIFVASQDGRFTVFYSAEGENQVVAIRTELLLV